MNHANPRCAVLSFQTPACGARSNDAQAPSRPDHLRQVAIGGLPRTLGVTKRIALLAVAALLSNTAHAQDSRLGGEFPFWAEKAWAEAAGRRSLQVSKRLNPFVWRGDFDGDGRPDLAVLVVDPKTRKEGIAFLFQRGSTAVVGAGSDFGNGGDDFSWMDVWQVQVKGTGHGNYRGQSVTPQADGLRVAKESSASALILFRNGRPIWQQLGD